MQWCTQDFVKGRTERYCAKDTKSQRNMASGIKTDVRKCAGFSEGVGHRDDHAFQKDQRLYFN